VVGVRPNLVTVELGEGPVARNEMALVLSEGLRLPAEVLRVRGRRADLQVFDDTRGIRVGDEVLLTGEMLSVTLGPGLLGQVFDGLQNPLEVLAREHGLMLPRGGRAAALPDRAWDFHATAREGDRLWPGDPFGEVTEGHLRHPICVPVDEAGPVRLLAIGSGRFGPSAPVGQAQRTDGSSFALALSQRWPVRRPLPERLLRERWAERCYPQMPLVTTMRLIDGFFPIARGGTACIPGPFGAGKTVLQGLIARHAAVGVVIVVACGERAGEVVETLTEFPQFKDPRSGGALMERTLIVCNTSAMPVAAREASIYTGITLGEYYRHLGHDVLVIADSTSRWAQAMRETSGRMEEIPGDEAYPAYLDSTIRALYERAGVVRRRDGVEGSLTLIGTVSPAGGSLDEPVTQATLAAVKTFLGLSAERAYRRAYPAVDPHLSWSRYPEQLAGWFRSELGAEWAEAVATCGRLLREARRVEQLIQVTGDDGITLEDQVLWHRAQLVDTVVLQQDAFDPVDASTPLPRQRELLLLVQQVVSGPQRFADHAAVAAHFDRATRLLRELNAAPWGGDEYAELRRQVEALASIGDADADRPGPR
jgi:V/A-type H+-transporting ATPase subunit A